MEEDKQNTNRADVLHQEHIEMVHGDITQSAIVGKLLAHQLMRYEPTNEDTSEEAHNRQEQLTCDEVEKIEDGQGEFLGVF